MTSRLSPSVSSYPLSTVGPSRLDVPQRLLLFGDTMKTGVMQEGKAKKKTATARCPVKARMDVRWGQNRGIPPAGFRCPRHEGAQAAPQLPTVTRRGPNDDDERSGNNNDNVALEEDIHPVHLCYLPPSTVSPSRRQQHTIVLYHTVHSYMVRRVT